MTAREYFAQLTGLQKTVALLPFIGGAFRSYTGVPFPPFGDSELVWRFATSTLVLCAAFAPILLSRASRKRWLTVCTGMLLAVFVSLYISANHKFVRGIQLPNDKWKFVTIGTKRLPSLDDAHRSMSDYDLVKDVGFTDSELERAYTRESLEESRWVLFFTYMPCLALLEFGLGLWVLDSTAFPNR